MRLTGAGLLLCLLLPAQSPPLRNPHTTPADVAAGAKIFRSHCADCHGLNGHGGKGPNLASGVFFHGSTDADLLKNITDGIPGTAMPNAFFSADQVWQIVAFVRSLGQGASRQAPGGDPANGARVYAAKACGNCHLVRGAGGIRGPDLSVIGSQRPASHIREAIVAPDAEVDQSFWRADVTLEDGTRHQGFLLNEDTYTVQILDPARGLMTLRKHDFRKFEVIRKSAMPSYEGKLQPAELDDLVAYLWSLQRPRRAE